MHSLRASAIGARVLAGLPSLPKPKRTLLAPGLTLVVGMTISTGAYFAVQQIYLSEAKKAFEKPAAQVAGVVSQALRQHLEVVNAVGAFVAASKEVDRWAFFEFARETLPRYPGVGALTWIPRVPAEDRMAFESRARDDGLFGFEFKESDMEIEPAAATPREEYFPLYYVEPFEGNEDLLGIDLAGSPSDLEVLEDARDVGELVAARDGSTISYAGRSDLMVIQPVFRSGGVPKTMQDRREELRGFVRADLDLGALMAPPLPAPPAPPGLDIYLYDEQAAPSRRLVAFHPSSLREKSAIPLPEDLVRAGVYGAIQQDFGGRRWSIWVKPVDEYFNANISVASWGAFIVGVILTLSLLQYIVASQNRTQAIELAVTERTAELRDSNEALETEINERERIERELRHAKEQSEIANRAKSDFLAMMSHELRTPLNAVIGFSDFLCQEALGPLGSDKYRGYANDIRRSGEELLRRISDILELSTIEGEGFTLNEETLEFPAILKEILPPIQDKADAAGLALRIEIDPDLPALHADMRSLKQMLSNILSNSVKFTPPGGEVALTVEQDSRGRLVVETRDNGIGIDPQHVAMVLQPFTQVDTSLARKYEGTGVGLALTQKLVQLHGGKLEIDSEPGAGTTVRIIFPKNRTVPAPPSDKVA